MKYEFEKTIKKKIEGNEWMQCYVKGTVANQPL